MDVTFKVVLNRQPRLALNLISKGTLLPTVIVGDSGREIVLALEMVLQVNYTVNLLLILTQRSPKPSNAELSKSILWLKRLCPGGARGEFMSNSRSPMLSKVSSMLTFIWRCMTIRMILTDHSSH